MARKSDVMASSAGERRMPKVVSHHEIHPTMDMGHRVEIHHTHSYDHPPITKEFKGPHAAVKLPKGHILHHIAQNLGIPVTGVAAGEEEPQSEKEGAEI